MSRAEQGAAPGVSAAGLPVAWFVCGEAAIIGLIFMVCSHDVGMRVLGASFLVGACLCAPWRGYSLVHRALDRVTFARSHGLEASPPDAWSLAQDEVELCDAVHAVFDGAHVVDMFDARGRSCGAAFYGECASVAVRARAPRDATGLPIDEVFEQLGESSVIIDSVMALTRSVPIPPDGTLGARMRGLALSAGVALPSESLFVVRVQRVDLERAMLARGGRREGQAAALTAVASRLRAALGSCGWSPETLSAREIALELEQTLGAASGQGWCHEWAGVRGPQVTHTTSSPERWQAGARLGDLATDAASTTWCAVERLSARQGRPSVFRILVRVTHHGGDEAGRFSAWGATQRTWSRLDGEQLAGLRATTILGEGL